MRIKGTDTNGFFKLFVIVSFAIQLVAGSAAWSDEVILNDGSKLVGQMQKLGDGKVVITTDFAGELTVETARVKGINTDQPRSVQLPTGERAVGLLQYSPQSGQTVAGQAVGTVPLKLDEVPAIWAADQDSPEVVGLKDELDKAKGRWSARLELGLNGQSGNTEHVAVNGRVEARRTTEVDRLLIYAQGRYSKENGNDTVKEVIGGVNLEVDLNDRLFAFGKLALEFDEVEDLDLRATVTGGLGYFVIREPGHEWKVRAGLGFQHESFMNGDSKDQAIGELGWDYRKEIVPWLLFTHSITYYPTFDDVGEYRLVMENAGEIPIGNKEDWKVRLGVRNDYDSMPEPGIDRLDTYYFLNLAWDWR